MIPYFPQPALPLGPFTIHAFGVLVAAAVLVGLSVLKRRSLAEGLDHDISTRLITYVLVCGFVGAHLVDRLVYFPAETLAEPWTLLFLWEGLSSFGGFLGGIAGALLFFRHTRLGDRTLRYLDAIAYALPFGWVLGRLGCFLAYDHPGEPTTFFLGQEFVDGVVRHNLGLEEALYTLPIVALFSLLGRKRRPAGFFLGLLAVLYAPARFFLDFLRVVDVRYLGLTPGQYGAIALLIAGLVILARSRARQRSPGVEVGEAEVGEAEVRLGDPVAGSGSPRSGSGSPRSRSWSPRTGSASPRSGSASPRQGR